MSEIKRYIIDLVKMEAGESPNGDWVRWEDVEGLVEAVCELAEMQEEHVQQCLKKLVKMTEKLIK